jgi:hypothetical protein
VAELPLVRWQRWPPHVLLLWFAKYTAQYTDPIGFRCGDVIQVERPDSEFTEWFWCRGPDRREGWVHRSFLSQSCGRAIATGDYSARELTVSVGDRGHVIRALNGWAYLQLEDDRAGWVPERVLHAPAL